MSVQKKSIKNIRTFQFYTKENKILTVFLLEKNIMFLFPEKSDNPWSTV